MQHTDLLLISLSKLSKFTKDINQKDVPEGMMRVSGLFAKLEKGVLNRNNREYDFDNYAQHIEQFRSKIRLGLGIYGELEHPKGMTINNNNISHKIEDIWFDRSTGEVHGIILLLDNEKGKILQSIIRSGGAIRLSSRATGKVTGTKAIITNLVTFDAVGSPGFEGTAMYLSESQMPTGERAIFESYLDQKTIIPGLWVPSSVNEAWETELFESYSVDLTVNEAEVQEDMIQIEPTNSDNKIDPEANIHTFQSTKNQNDMNTEDKIKELFEDASFKAALSSSFNAMLVEAEERCSTESVIHEQMQDKYMPVFEQWVVNEFAPTVQSWLTEHYSPKIETFLTEQFAPTFVDYIVKVLESRGLTLQVNENEGESFVEYVDTIRESEQAIAEGQELFQNLLETAQDASVWFNTLATLDESAKHAATLTECETRMTNVISKINESTDTETLNTVNESIESLVATVNTLLESDSELDGITSQKAIALLEANGTLSEVSALSKVNEALTAFDTLVESIVVNEAGKETVETDEEAPKATESDEDTTFEAATVIAESIEAGETPETVETVVEETVVTESTDLNEGSYKWSKKIAKNKEEEIKALSFENRNSIGGHYEKLPDAKFQNAVIEIKESKDESSFKSACTKALARIKELDSNPELLESVEAVETVVEETVVTEAAVEESVIVEAVEAPKTTTLLESLHASIRAAKEKPSVITPEATVNENVEEEKAYLKHMPEKYAHIYESLNESQKDVIDRQASLRVIETPVQVEAFWNSRNFNDILNTKVGVVNEAAPQSTQSAYFSNLKSVCARLMK